MKRFLISAFIVAALSGCNSSPKASHSSPKPKPFPQVSVPTFITSRAEVLKYVAEHYWDRYLDSVKVFSKDTAYIGGVTKDNFDEAYREYINVLWQVPTECSYKAQKKIVSAAEKLKAEDTTSRIFDYLTEVSEQALYGVNSDYRNEELFLPVLEVLSKSPLVDSVLRIKYQSYLADCSLNRIGTKAANFTYSTNDGHQGSLYKVSSDFILLFFSNPGCHSCLEIIENLKQSLRVQYLISEKRLKVLNIYIDEDLTEWFKYMPIYPKEWINAYEPNLDIRNKNLYSVRAIPSLYILDKDKNVILKDVAPTFAIGYLESIE